jgi:hypothetical protein
MPDGKPMECCSKAMKDGKKMACCEKHDQAAAGAHSGHDKSKH